MNAEVIGLSNENLTEPAMFTELNLGSRIDHHICDIRDLDKVQSLIAQVKPDFLFHFAAQSLVSLSYQNPVETITTNVVGTANILEALKNINSKCIAIIVTSDKCYENVEWIWGYRESDPMGGKDIYSASKGSAELIFKAYFHSFFNKPESKVKLATGRAGNVIGGGDWAKDRIVADCMRSWSESRVVEIRSPAATRPWQHVLEPLSGYLCLAAELHKRDDINGESFNFGPKSDQNKTVLELLRDLSKHWNFDDVESACHVMENAVYREAGLLKLNCDKAISALKWQGTLDYLECVRMVSDWYRKFYRENGEMYRYTIDQITEYETFAQSRGLNWSK
jgi:CDP-glucose 4,6-dehydratase